VAMNGAIDLNTGGRNGGEPVMIGWPDDLCESYKTISAESGLTRLQGVADSHSIQPTAGK